MPTLSTSDKDLGLSGTEGIVYSFDSKDPLPFMVDPLTGEIYVTNETVTLDREDASSYTLTVRQKLTPNEKKIHNYHYLENF